MKNSYPEFFEFDFYVVQLFLIASIVLLMLIVAPLVKSKKYIPYLFFIAGYGTVSAANTLGVTESD